MQLKFVCFHHKKREIYLCKKQGELIYLQILDNRGHFVCALKHFQPNLFQLFLNFPLNFL